MTVNKFRVSMSERNGDLKGKVEIEADPAFMLEALLLVIQQFADRHQVTVTDVLNDINALAMDKVK